MWSRDRIADVAHADLESHSAGFRVEIEVMNFRFHEDMHIVGKRMTSSIERVTLLRDTSLRCEVKTVLLRREDE